MCRFLISVYTSDEEASEEEELEDEEFKDPRKFSNLEKVNLQISVYQNSMDFSKNNDRFRNSGDRMQRFYKTNPALKNRSGWSWIKFEVRKSQNQYVEGPEEWMEGPKSLNIVSITPIVHDSYTKHRSPLLHGFLYMYNNRSSKYNLNIPFFHSEHKIKMLECELYDGFVDYKEGIDKDECSSAQNSLNIDFCLQKRIIDKSLPVVFMKEIERVGDKLTKLMIKMQDIIATAERPAQAPVKTEAEIAREEAERIMQKNREDAEEAAARRVAQQELVKTERDANIRAEQTSEHKQDKRRRDPRRGAAFLTTYEDEIHPSHLPPHLPPELTQKYSSGSSAAGSSEYSAATNFSSTARNVPPDWTPQLASQYQWDASIRPAPPVWNSDQEQKQHGRTEDRSADVKTENDGSEAQKNPRKRPLDDSNDPVRKLPPGERAQFYRDILKISKR